MTDALSKYSKYEVTNESAGALSKYDKYAVTEPSAGFDFAGSDPGLAPIETAAPTQRAVSPLLYGQDAPASPLIVSGPDEDAEIAKDAQFAGYFEEARGANPNGTLTAYNLSKTTGAPIGMVRDRLADFQKADEVAKTDIRRWRRENPELAYLLTVHPQMGATVVKERTRFNAVVDPEHSEWARKNPITSLFADAAAVDAVDPSDRDVFDLNSGRTETVRETKTETMQDLSHLGAADATADALRRGIEQNKIAREGYARMWADRIDPNGEKARMIREDILERQQNLGLPAMYNGDALTRIGTTVAEASTSQIDSAAALGVGSAVGIITRKPQIGAAVAKIIGANASFIAESGGAYNEFVDARDDQGRVISKDIAFAGAALYGALATVIEVGTLGKEAQGISALSTKKAVAGMLLDKTKRGALLDLAKQLGKNAGSEAGEESAQQGLQIVLGWLTRSASAGEAQSFDMRDAVEEVASAGFMGAVGSVVPLGAVTAASNTAADLRRIGDSHRAGSQVAAITDLGKTDAAKAAPKEVAAFIAEQSQDGRKVTHLFVDPTRLVEEAIKGGADAREVATELMGPDGPQRLQDALESHGDAAGARATLEVPVAEYLEKWGGKPIAEALVNDMSTGAGLLTMGEQKLFQSAPGQAEADAIADEAEADDESPEVTAASGTVEQKLVAAGQSANVAKQSAEIVTKMAKSLAKASGRPVAEHIAELSNIAGVGTQQAATQTLEQGAVDDQRALLQRTYGALDDTAKQRAYFTDDNTGLLNERGFPVQPLDPSRTYLAEFEVPGKFINKVSQGTLDGAYRAMAGALRSAGITDGAKIGGSIRAWVRDEAHAREIEKAMTSAVAEPRIRVTYAAVAAPGGLSDEVGDALGAEAKGVKKTLGELGLIGSRKGIPPALARAEDPAIAWDEGMKGISPYSPEARSVVDRAVGELADFRDRMLAVPTGVANADLSPAHVDAYTRDAAADSEAVFSRIYYDAAGLLSDAGRQIAMRENGASKPHVITADVDYFAEMNQAFGKEQVDAINWAFGEALRRHAEARGIDADLWHPHGDEYGGQSANAEELTAVFEDARKEVANFVFVGQNPKTGDIWIQEGLSFGDATGTNLDDAEARLDAAKAESKYRAERGEGERAGKPPRRVTADEARDIIARGEGSSVRRADGLDEDSPRVLFRLEDLTARWNDAKSREAGRRQSSRADRVADAGLERLEQSPAWYYDASRVVERRESLALDKPMDLQPQAVLEKLASAGFVSGSGGVSETGQQLLDRMSKRLGSKEAAVDALQAAGLSLRGTTETLFQDDAKSPRGWINIARDGVKTSYKIFLTKKADASTFVHELSHQYAETLSEIATAHDAPEAAKADWAKVEKWVGAKPGQPLTVEQKEKFARGFEAYLFEGKAPSSAMAEVFASFRRWMKDIYKSIAALGVDLNDDIRGVYDRMLATDQEIERAKSAAGLDRPVFATPEEAGVSPEEFDAYLAQQERVRSEVVARTQRMHYEAELRAAKAYKTEEFRRLREEYSAEWDQLPQVRAWRYLRLGEVLLPDGSVVADKEQGRLDRDTVIQLVGKKHPIVKRLAGRLVKNGEDPIEASDMFGFTAGARAMLETLAGLPDKETWVRSEAERALKEKHPEIEGEIADLQQKLQELLHTDSFDTAEREFQMIQARVKSPTTIEALKRAAKRSVDNRAVGRLDPGAVLNRERSFANHAAQAIAEGNWDRAMAFKLRQLLHKYMWRELVDAKDFRDKWYDLASDMNSDRRRGKLGKAGAAYRDVSDAILEAVQAHPPRDYEGRRLDLGDLLAKMDADGNTVAFEDDFIAQVLQAADGRNWKEMKVSELRQVYDALRNIRSAASNVTEMRLGKTRVDMDTLAAALIEDAKANIRKDIEGQSTRDAASPIESANSLRRGVSAILLRVEEMLEDLGGDNIDSPWHAISAEFQRGKAKKADMVAKIVEPISQAFENIPLSVRVRMRQRIDGRALFPNHVKGVPVPKRRYELLMLALNAGSTGEFGNRDRLLEGRGISDAELRAALSLLTKEELEWVQAVWDQIESLWPQIRELEERDNGLPPPKIKATPFVVTTADGAQVAMRGGYFPMVYDQRDDTGVGMMQEISNAADVLDTLLRPGTSRSHTKSRSAGASGAVSLEPSTILGHILRVTNDVAYREPLRAAAKIFSRPDIRQVVREKLGEEREKGFLQWLRDIGRSEAALVTAASGRVEGFLRGMRAGFATVVLGYNFANQIGDLGVLFSAPIGARLSKTHYATALARSARSPRKSYQFVLSKSGEVRSRTVNEDVIKKFRSNQQALTRGPLGQAKGVIIDHAFFLSEAIEKAAVVPIWMGAYNQALAEGRTDEHAVDFAERAIRMAFPSKDVVDKSAIQRDRGFLGFIGQFMGYANSVYNQYAAQMRPVLRAEGYKENAFAFTRFMLDRLALLVVVGPVGMFLVGQGPDEDEPLEEWIARKILTAQLMVVPMIGGDIDGAINGRINVRAAPGFATLIAAYKAIERGLAKDDEDPMNVIVGVVNAFGYLSGVPTPTFTRMADYFAEGDYDNDGGVPAALLYGNREDQPTNLLNMADR